MKTFLPVVLLVAVAACCSAADLKQITQLGNKVLFSIEDQGVNAIDAKAKCEQQGLVLAAIENSGEQNAVKGYLLGRAEGGKDIYHGWLGGSDEGSTGKWYWIYNKQSISYNNWGNNGPDTGKYSHCLRISPDGSWTATYCEELNDGLPICQKLV